MHFKAWIVALTLLLSGAASVSAHADCYWSFDPYGMGTGEDWDTDWDDLWEYYCEPEWPANPTEQDCAADMSSLSSVMNFVGENAPTVIPSANIPKASCTTTVDECRSICYDTLSWGVNSDLLGFAAGYAVGRASGAFAAFDLGTPARAAFLRACVAGTGYGAAAITGWFAGITAGCYGVCKADSCYWDGYK